MPDLHISCFDPLKRVQIRAQANQNCTAQKEQENLKEQSSQPQGPQLPQKQAYSTYFTCNYYYVDDQMVMYEDGVGCVSALLILSPAPRGSDTWSSSTLYPCVSDEEQAKSGSDVKRVKTQDQEDGMRQAAEGEEEEEEFHHAPKVPAAEEMQQVELLRRFQNISGIYEFDWHSVQPASLTPGKVREIIGARNGYQQQDTDTGMKQELSWLRSVWGRLKWSSVKGWREEAILNTAIHVMQFHVQMDMDTRGIPYLIMHTRIRYFGYFETPWRVAWQVSLDGKSQPEQNLNFRDKKKVYAFFTLMRVAQGGCGITQLHYSAQPHPGFPQEMPQSGQNKPKRNGHASKLHPTVGSAVGGSGVEGESEGGGRGVERFFLLRSSEFVNNGNGVVVQSGYLNGHGKFTFKWNRVSPVDKTLVRFDEPIHSARVQLP